MMNSWNGIGRVVRDPEVRKTQTGKSVVNFTLACERGFGDKKKTEFVNLQAWNAQANFIGDYLKQGSLVAVEGHIQSRSYEDSSGRKVYIQEVLVNSIKSLSTRSESYSQGFPQEISQSSHNNSNSVSSSNDFESDSSMILDITSDDLPF